MYLQISMLNVSSSSSLDSSLDERDLTGDTLWGVFEFFGNS